MDEVQGPKGTWWQTLPGILTAAAATITAIGGVLAIIIPIFITHSPEDKDGKPIVPKFGTLVGTWVGSNDCDVVISSDNANTIEGSCDKSGYRHKLTGTYESPDTVKTTIIRTDPKGCTISAQGYIKPTSKNTAEFGQSAWNGCGSGTPSTSQILMRR